MSGSADPGRQVAEAFAAMRRQIDRDLCERLQLRLIELRYELRLAREQIPPEAQDAVRALEHVDDRVADAVDDLHAIRHRAYPPALRLAGLAQALSVLARRSGLPVDLDVAETGRLPEPVELVACDIVSETLAGARAHAGAGAARVRVAVADGSLHLTVFHDGTRATPASSALTDRVQMLGGAITTTNGAGREPSVVLRVPVGAD